MGISASEFTTTSSFYHYCILITFAYTTVGNPDQHRKLKCVIG